MSEPSANGHRKRLRRREIPLGIRFVTFSCEGRLPLFGRAAIRDIAADALAAKVRQHQCDLYAWVVMPEHMHLVARPGKGRELGALLESFKKSVAWTVLQRWRRLDAPILRRITDERGTARFWLKGGGFDRNIRDNAEFAREVKYIHRNPVERGLVESPESWGWSSASWWLGRDEPRIECQEPAWIPAAARRRMVFGPDTDSQGRIGGTAEQP